MENKVIAHGSIEFRNAIMDLDRRGFGATGIFVREAESGSPVYRIVPRHTDPFQIITLDSLFRAQHPPTYMEDFAVALIQAGDDAPAVEIFTL